MEGDEIRTRPKTHILPTTLFVKAFNYSPLGWQKVNQLPTQTTVRLVTISVLLYRGRRKGSTYSYSYHTGIQQPVQHKTL